MWRLRLMLVLCVLISAAGCARTTVDFEQPAGTEMTVEDARYTWPVGVTFARPSQTGEKNVHPLRLAVPTGRGELPVEGEIQIFGYRPVGEDRYAEHEVSLTSRQLRALRQGERIRLTGESPSGGLVYRIHLQKTEAPTTLPAADEAE